jgi:hypothetical protein
VPSGVLFVAANDVGPKDPIKLGHRGIGFLLNQSARAISAQFDEELRLFDLDHAGLVLLRNTLRECNFSSENSIRVTELAVRLILPTQEITEEALRLQRDGWLEVRGEVPMVELAPTKKAIGVLPVLLDKTRWTSNRALNGFSAEEIETLTEMLRRVIRNFDAYAGPDEEER